MVWVGTGALAMPLAASWAHDTLHTKCVAMCVRMWLPALPCLNRASHSGVPPSAAGLVVLHAQLTSSSCSTSGECLCLHVQGTEGFMCKALMVMCARHHALNDLG